MSALNACGVRRGDNDATNTSRMPSKTRHFCLKTSRTRR